ncbi:ribonuclease H-like domain-containing protein [Lentinula aciculospora]|uniref:Ribonuclease H-like domain-containing protein n=1 Tax=Lentinula aciculospora TaxID=153920 RepID=A0A9W9AIA4_9AGAR|nr:ribonuclease H-like domain-containing protein [Lentinula aciculospora]
MSFQESLISSEFNEMNSQIQTSALRATRNSMLLPSDINFHRTMDTELSRDLDIFSSRILSVANQVLALIDTADFSGKDKGKLENEDDVVDNFHSIVLDTMDRMLEKTDMSLDEFLGRNKAPAIAINANVNSALVKNKLIAQKAKHALNPAIQHASHLPKPQLNFRKKVDNTDVPWYPTLSRKYNAQFPLGSNFYDPDHQVETNSPTKLHPYRYEIIHISYPPRMFQSSQPIPPTPFESTTFEWVSTVAELEGMLDQLRGATEIAVDLEHHSYRSYLGFLCLMQISTRQQDWIVDLLMLREELGVLNEVLTDPKITKVLHGAESDIVWLQQDLNLYIVNLFDTFHASKLLGFPRHGLANLLEMYCDFTPDKRFQLADWRIRPLPQEMLDYARSDTHFLLYIYDNLRNALLDRAISSNEPSLAAENTSSSSHSFHFAQALMRQALAKSETTALRVYEKELYDMEGGSGGNGWDTLAKKWNKHNLYANTYPVGIPGMQKDIYRRIHLWRDIVSREEDESVRYVLPNHFLFQLAEQPPTDMASMLKIFHFVPPILRRRAKELLDVIREVTEEHAIPNDEGSKQHVGLVEASTTLVEQQHSPNLTDSLWTLGSHSTNLSVSSSLFGSDSLMPSASGTITARFFNSRSALFGKALLSPTNNVSSSLPLNRLTEVVARIRSTLIITPIASYVSVKHEAKEMTLAHKRALEESLSLEGGTLDSAIQAEMPFIPSAQRGINTSATAPVEDSIVVVGQARQKKRKRVKTISSSDQGITKESDVDMVPFDFASTTNILDATPSTEQTAIPRKKAKQAKARGVLYGDFPAPPKAYNEVKTGNKSHTFK